MSVLPMEIATTPSFAGPEALLPRQDAYAYYPPFTESEPDLAYAAQVVQAESYYAAGFFAPGSGIDPTQPLPPDIDKARGPSVEYRLGVNPENPRDAITLRKRHVPEGETYKDHPAYKLSEGALYPQGEAFLADLPNPSAQIKEIGAFGRTSEASPLALHEMLRDEIQRSLDSDEVWLFSIVSTTRDFMARYIGTNNLEQIGDNVKIPDDRVSEKVELCPAILVPREFVDNMLDTYLRASTGTVVNLAARERAKRYFLFYTEGLSADQMSPTAYAARRDLLAAQESRRSAQ